MDTVVEPADEEELAQPVEQRLPLNAQRRKAVLCGARATSGPTP